MFDICLFETNLQALFYKIGHDILAFSPGTLVIIFLLLVAICVLIYVNCFGMRSRTGWAAAAETGEAAPGMEDERLDSLPGPSLSLAFIDRLLAVARAKNIPLAPLQTVLARLVDAGLSDADIPSRLLAATDQLEMLRSTLANLPAPPHGHDQVRAEALACIDRGDLDAASELLRRSREAYWTLSSPTTREEAEFYAREAMIDHLQYRFCDAAEKYAFAAALVSDCEGPQTWRFLAEQARELCDDGREFDKREGLLRAVEVCHCALGLVPREQFPHEWAATKHRLADALFLLGKRAGDPDRLQEAVESYLATLEECDREGAPRDWAKAQTGLGIALQALGEREGDTARLREAAEAYRAALAKWTKETDPTEWAHAQARLGDVLAELGIEEGDGQCLMEAIAAYTEALAGMSREVVPIEWAIIQNNLGNVLRAIGEAETTSGRLHEAVAAYQQALQEGLLAPLSFATAKTNLGNALATIGERENDRVMLEKAVSAYRVALEAVPAHAAPLDTAKTQMSLAYALGALWNQTRKQQLLDEALSAVEAAICLIEGHGGHDDIPAKLLRETILAAFDHHAAVMSAA